MMFSKENIRKALQGELPGQRSHSKLLPPNRVLKAAADDRVKNSSVLLLLFEEDSELKVLLIKRAVHMKHHAGQIALPGGRVEANETAIETALRETYEEIGVGEDKIEILGKLSGFYVEVSRFQIWPVVGWLESKPVFRINPDEVEKIIFFPIEKFKPPYDEIKIDTLTGTLDVPCVKFAKEIIWGATAMILSEFYDVLQKAGEVQSS
ncbi:NUDIX hydrolase [Maribellus sediminis]|uniref:NUDIX hydrolase n=1 Tax=Maribellus sediminis TaxID=2696285 RepID=UPI00142FD07E|nr:CoA pyrophosphatase [Maribellus sediminis]